MAERVPDSARESVMDWQFADRPLQLPGLDPVRTRLSRPDVGEMVRFIGVFTHVDDEYGVVRPFGEGIGASSTEMRFNIPLGRHAGKISLLRGLRMDMNVRIEHKPEGLDRDASLVAVHGFEQQVKRGDFEGLLRGEITDVARGDSGDVWHTELVSAGDRLFTVYDNPSNDNESLVDGNLVALRVTAGYRDGEYMHDRLPGFPLQSSILLQGAVALPAA